MKRILCSDRQTVLIGIHLNFWSIKTQKRREKKELFQYPAIFTSRLVNNAYIWRTIMKKCILNWHTLYTNSASCPTHSIWYPLRMPAPTQCFELLASLGWSLMVTLKSMTIFLSDSSFPVTFREKISTAKFNTVSNVILSYSGFVLIRFPACREKKLCCLLNQLNAKVESITTWSFKISSSPPRSSH